MISKKLVNKIMFAAAGVALLFSLIISDTLVYAKEKEATKSVQQQVNSNDSNIKKPGNGMPGAQNVTNPIPTLKKGIYTVAQDGTGDFATIASASIAVPSGSTLIIKDGIYNEALTIQGKVVNMRGTSKEKCIIQYDTNNYSFVPLNICGGTYENLTINGYHKQKQKVAFAGYAIHIDNDCLANQTVNFNNCNIISENAFCVGIGLRKGAKINFRGCNFVSKKQGVMLFHDSQTPSLAGTASITMENCVLNNNAEQLIVTQSISPASTTNLTFKNNTVIGNGDGFCLAYGSYAGNGNGWMGSQNVNLSPLSSGNNIMSFNYKDMATYYAQQNEKQNQLALAKAAEGKVNPVSAAGTGASSQDGLPKTTVVPNANGKYTVTLVDGTVLELSRDISKMNDGVFWADK